MGAPIALRNIVRIAEHVFLVAIIPLQRRLHTDIFVHGRREVKHGCCGLVDLVAVKVLDERAYAALVFEDTSSCLGTLIDQFGCERPN